MMSGATPSQSQSTLSPFDTRLSSRYPLQGCIHTMLAFLCPIPFCFGLSLLRGATFLFKLGFYHIVILWPFIVLNLYLFRSHRIREESIAASDVYGSAALYVIVAICFILVYGNDKDTDDAAAYLHIKEDKELVNQIKANIEPPFQIDSETFKSSAVSRKHIVKWLIVSRILAAPFPIIGWFWESHIKASLLELFVRVTTLLCSHILAAYLIYLALEIWTMFYFRYQLVHSFTQHTSMPLPPAKNHTPFIFTTQEGIQQWTRIRAFFFMFDQARLMALQNMVGMALVSYVLVVLYTLNVLYTKGIYADQYLIRLLTGLVLSLVFLLGILYYGSRINYLQRKHIALLKVKEYELKLTKQYDHAKELLGDLQAVLEHVDKPLQLWGIPLSTKFLDGLILMTLSSLGSWLWGMLRIHL